MTSDACNGSSALHSIVVTTVPNVEGSVVFVISLRQGATATPKPDVINKIVAYATKPRLTVTAVRRLTNWRRRPLTGIVELEDARQQLQGPREVIGATSMTSGYNGSPRIGSPKRGHVHPQLMRAPRARRQPIQAVAQMLDHRLRVRLAGSSTACNCPRRLIDSAAHHRRKARLGSTPARARYVLRTSPRANSA